MTINYGPFVFGGNVFGWTADKETSFRLLDIFVAEGGTAIDTADVYSAWVPGNSGGDSEKIIGEWLQSRGKRDDVLICTKVGMWPERMGLSEQNIRAAVEDSLLRLKTDYIDLYYAHKDDEKTPQEEVVFAFDRLVREGKIRAVGCSNFAPHRLEAALKIAKDKGMTGFSVSQDHWNLVERMVEDELIPVLEKNEMTQLPYFSLASGFLTGKYRPGVEVDSQRAQGASGYLKNPRNLEILAAMDRIAAQRGVSHTAIALSWLRSQPCVGAPIASARTEDQLRELLNGATFLLQDDELEMLNYVSNWR